MQAQYDAYVANEVFSVHRFQCQTGASGWPRWRIARRYHAANTLLQASDHVKRCYALSGVYDLRDSMDGMYRRQFLLQ